MTKFGYNDSKKTIHSNVDHDRVHSLHATKGWRSSRIRPPLPADKEMNTAERMYASFRSVAEVRLKQDRAAS